MRNQHAIDWVAMNVWQALRDAPPFGEEINRLVDGEMPPRLQVGEFKRNSGAHVKAVGRIGDGFRRTSGDPPVPERDPNQELRIKKAAPNLR